MDIIIYKTKRLLICLEGGRELLRTSIQLGFGADDGPKLREGDGRTPEGRYVVSSKNPNSRFHLALGISYPGPHDAARGLEDGIIDEDTCRRICASTGRPPWDTPMGGFIMIHGQKSPPVSGDWTAGCIAVPDDIIDRIFPEASLGDSVVIYP